MDNADLGLKIFEILSPLLLAALTWVAAKVAQLINAKVKNEYLRGVLVRLDDAVFTSVREIHQATVEQLKTASADGRLTPEERAQVKQAAIDSAKAQLGMKGMAEIAKVLGIGEGAIDKLLSTRVEAAVHDLKRARVGGVGEGADLPFAA